MTHSQTSLGAEIAYSRFANQYSQRNWVSSEPHFNALSDDYKKFWIQLVSDIKGGFSVDKDKIPLLKSAQ